MPAPSWRGRGTYRVTLYITHDATVEAATEADATAAMRADLDTLHDGLTARLARWADDEQAEVIADTSLPTIHSVEPGEGDATPIAAPVPRDETDTVTDNEPPTRSRRKNGEADR